MRLGRFMTVTDFITYLTQEFVTQYIAPAVITNITQEFQPYDKPLDYLAQLVGVGNATKGFLCLEKAEQTIPDSTYVVIEFSNEVFDTEGFWSPGAPSIITIPPGRAGIYIIIFTAYWDAYDYGDRYIEISWMGVSWYVTGKGSGLSASCNPATFLLPLAAEDGLQVKVAQTSGGSLNINNMVFAMARVQGYPT